MRYKMYSVKDELTGKFMSPMFTEETKDTKMSDSLAIREFRSHMNNIQLWKDNPNDYSLYIVGIFDDETGAEATVLEKVISGRSLING